MLVIYEYIFTVIEIPAKNMYIFGVFEFTVVGLGSNGHLVCLKSRLLFVLELLRGFTLQFEEIIANRDLEFALCHPLRTECKD